MPRYAPLLLPLIYATLLLMLLLMLLRHAAYAIDYAAILRHYAFDADADAACAATPYVSLCRQLLLLSAMPC